MARPKAELNITEAQRTLLEHISRSRELPHSLTQRVQIILLAAQGKDNKTISRELNLCQDTVGLWRKRWVTGSSTLEPLNDKPKRLRHAISQLLADKARSGSPCTFTAEQVCQIIAQACETPPEHLSHWTRSALAYEVTRSGIVEHISESTIGRFLKSGRA